MTKTVTLNREYLGPVNRWQEDDILHVENDFVSLAYVYTDDPAKVGTCGWHGRRQIWVEYIARPYAQGYYPLNVTNHQTGDES